MKQSVIIEMKSDELVEKLQLELEQYDKMKISHTVSQLENPLTIQMKRRTISRIKTELRKRELAK
jgi:large subunit ribosomal protein L29|tara:strand:- start:947 stop:1141 length:195 start_codon:yes stop_codon:yes gene_type:complete